MNKYRTILKSKTIVPAIALLLASLRGSVFWPFFIDTDSLVSLAWVEIGAWILLAAFIVHILRKNGDWGKFMAQWRNERFLLVFLLFAFFSMFWSISFSASLYRTSILLLSSLAGGYIGYQFGSRRLLDILFWFGALVVISSFELILLEPRLSVMSGNPYIGSWRGIYWHRNHLGAMAALINVVYLMRMVSEFRIRSKMLILDAFFYILSLVLIYCASSAAGYIVASVLHFSIIVAVVWLRYSHHLKRIHYAAISGIAIMGGVFLFTNLSFFFGIFNRTTSLTGRIPMWDYLLKYVVSRSPWVGYGFGAIWTKPAFRAGLQGVQGWLHPILIGDNGFMDILLYVGGIGLALFLGFWIRVWILSFQHGIRHRTLLDFFPIIFMIFTLMANITFSLFLETETFVWLTLVAVIFALAKDLVVLE